ncbi:MAG: prepilin-type N-terminal cleavage/methylation domain-containing protein [Planctomycetes bacterium]|nr:prepilin-type N-terminal cleavage/methylation domain-containing protein [Planctomycetota bacterium]
MNNKLTRKGFSLIEMIAAAVLLSTGVVTICAVGTHSMTNIKLNRENELAWEVLDRQLTVIDYTGIEEFLEYGMTSGEVESPDGGVHYWEMSAEEGYSGNLYNVAISVSWGPLEHRRSVSAVTVLNGSGIFAEEEEEEETMEEDSGAMTSDAR